MDEIKTVKKRDGRIVPMDREKIVNAIFKAAQAMGGSDRSLAEDLADAVVIYLNREFAGRVPSVEEIQDIVEKVLIKTGHAKTAKAYILYRQRRARIRQIRAGILPDELKLSAAEIDSLRESTDLALFVRTSKDDIVTWNRERIVDALCRETELSRNIAEIIALEVEEEIVASKIGTLTAPLIREMVNAKLVEYGFEQERRRHTRLGMPLYDVRQVITLPNKENANIPHNPEATNLSLAEAIKKEYALLEVFSPEVADAHLAGDIHLHDLGMCDRPYCSGQSLEYVKKFGLSLPNALSIAKPARHGETLLAHMVKFSAALQGHFAGAIGWDAVNYFFAPYLEGMSDRDIKQLAQMLIYEYSQQAVARGGQAIFSDINIYWEVPDHFEKTPAIGPGGQYTGKTYAEYQPEAQKFAWALFEVYLQGDGLGRPFFFPKPLCHLTNKLFKTPGAEEYLTHICRTAAEKGNTYFVFDRGKTAKVSECCRLSFVLDSTDLSEAATPWKMRFCALQNVTINLPRAAYRAAGDDTRLFEELDRMLGLVVKAHQQKKAFISRLLSLGDRGPLALLTMKTDGETYLRMNRVSYLIGLLGLNEMVQFHLGRELHEDEAALRFGLKVIAYINLACQRLSRELGLKFVLEQTPAESTAYRMAKLDLAHFPIQAGKVVKGTPENGGVYYTNSTYLNVTAPLAPGEKVKQEGLFHPLIEAGALTHVWLGESKPDPLALANFVKKTFTATQNAQIAFSPEFTACLDCGRVSRGLSKECPYCKNSAREEVPAANSSQTGVKV
ncbi:MAG TPA: anaerobic ribonucleoside-triphosphate reductase [bacterium]|nr:anaerobic ribonucleoside-triphosphate reductase [bacterium]HNS47944.1 anaerobic ribonucleoside-triphosphate reductase [bacterium]